MIKIIIKSSFEILDENRVVVAIVDRRYLIRNTRREFSFTTTEITDYLCLWTCLDIFYEIIHRVGGPFFHL